MNKFFICRDNVLQLASSLAMGLFLGFCIPRANAVLMQEGSRLRRSTFLQRYLGIAAHVKLWIFSDMDGKSEGYRDVIRTRKLHLAYAKSFKAGATLPDLPPLDERQERLLAAVSSDLASVDLDLAPELLDYHPSVPMAQLDMGLTIFALYGFFALFPEDMGARGGPKSKGYGAFVHLCAVLGNLFGVEDRLNPALHYYRNADAKAQEGVGGCFLASLKHIDAYGMNSLIVTFRECSRFVPGLLRLHVFLYFVVNNLILRGRGLQAKAIRRELTKMDLFLYYIFCSTQRVLSRSEVIRTCANKLALLLVTILVKFYLWKFKRPTRKS